MSKDLTTTSKDRTLWHKDYAVLISSSSTIYKSTLLSLITTFNDKSFQERDLPVGLKQLMGQWRRKDTGKKKTKHYITMSGFGLTEDAMFEDF